MTNSKSIDEQHDDMVRRLAKPGAQIKTLLSPSQADLWHHATGIATEAGELLDAAKKVAIYQLSPDRENIIEELGDLEFYMAGVRNNLGITREETLVHNMEKLARRYPHYEYSDGKATTRADKLPAACKFDEHTWGLNEASAGHDLRAYCTICKRYAADIAELQ